MKVHGPDVRVWIMDNTKVNLMGTRSLQFKADLVRLYCTQFGLNFRTKAEAPLVQDPEEWEETEAAGFDDDPVYGATIIYVTTDGDISVITHFADGRGLLEDKFETITVEEIMNAIIKNVSIHPL